ncbi:MAG: glycosyltransferase family 4 protein [Actinobacteria bacterium]|nr:glycosyltransferase family 4 protein [Actinomycetota bacterium]
MIKVLYFHHEGGIGGAPQSLRFLIEGLPRNKFDPIVVCLKDGPVVDLFRESGARVITGRGIHDYSHTYLDWYGISSPVRFITKFLNFFSTVVGAKKIIADEDPDIVHLNSSTLSAFAIAAKASGKKVIWHIREPIARGYFGVRRAILRWMINRYSDQVIAICNDNARRLKSSSKVNVIYNYVDFDFFDRNLNGKVYGDELGIPEDGKVVLMLGGTSKPKGTLVFLEVAKEILKVRRDYYFILAGNFPDFSRLSGLKRFANKLPWVNRYNKNVVKIASTLPNTNFILSGSVSDVPLLIAASDVVVFPSTVPHFPRPLIEAGAMAKPTIASNLPGPDEVIIDGESGLLIRPGDVNELIAAIEKVLGDDDLTRAMGERAYEIALTKFNKEINLPRIVAIYEELVADK